MSRSINPDNPTEWTQLFLRSDTPWDLGQPSPTLVDLEKKAELRPGISMIVPGCGRGHDALHFARLGYQVSAVDWAKPAIEEVRLMAKREALTLEALCGDFWQIPESWHGSFDAWVEHTFFCAIAPARREDYVRQAVRLLRPGAHFLGCFFISSRDGEPLFEHSLGGPPYGSSEGRVRELFEPHFRVLKLEPSPRPHANRPPGLEWAAHFQLK